MEHPRSAIIRFAHLRLDLRSGELWNGTERVILPDQPFRIVAALIRRNGELVSRDELRRELWAEDTFVDFEHGLNAAIKRLRELLGDSASAPRFIETIPRRGYRFIAAVEEHVDPAPVTSGASLAISDTATTAAARPRPQLLARLGALVVIASTAGFVSSTWLRGSPQALSRSQLVRLTSASGLNIDPALSADGSLLAFASDRSGTGNLDIWIQPVNGGEPTRLTDDPADDVEPSFSPDGASVVFARRENGGIYVVGARGGEPRALVRGSRARNPRFSPDGRSVVYWTGQTVWTAGPRSLVRDVGENASKLIPGVVGALFVVPATGGPSRPLADEFISARYGTWSPDGQILFLGERVANGAYSFDWFVVRPDGSHSVSTGALDALRRAGITGVPIPGAWKSTGDVVFTPAHEDTANVWQLRVSTESGRVTGSPQRLTFGTALERDPAVSADGRTVFVSVDDNVDVWRVPLDPTTGLAGGALERVTDDVEPDVVQNVSADGATLAFASRRTKLDEIWLMEMRTRHVHQLTHTGGIQLEAEISPDGSHVAVGDWLGHHRVELYKSSGESPTTLCTDCDVGGWSADASRLLIARRAATRRVVLDLATRREAEFASHPNWYLNKPQFSRDNRWVVFHTTNAPELRQIYVVPAFTGGAVPFADWVPVVTDFGIQPSWAPDGAGVYHFSNRDGYFCAWLQPVDPATKRPVGEPQAVLHLHQPSLRAAFRAGATNDVQGGYLYMTLTTTTGNIWMLDAAKD